MRAASRAALLLGLAFVGPLARPASAQPVAKASFLAEGSFDLPASGPGALERPRSLAWAAPDLLHIADERGTVVVLDGTGAFVRTYGAGVLRRTAGIVVDAEGRAYVLDPDQKGVFVFDPAGEVAHRIGTSGSGAGQLADPVDVALGPTGLVYVLDKGRKGVQVFSRDGTFVHDLAFSESIGDPRALGVSPSGRIWVADRDLPDGLIRLVELTEAIGTVDAPAEAEVVQVRAGNLREPTAVVTTPTGTIVAADRNSGVLWAIDGRGEATVGSDDRLYGGSGSGRGSFRRLEDAAVAGDDQLVMLDSDGRKIERVQLVIEGDRNAAPVMDYPVLFQQVESDLDPGVLATAPRQSGTSWFAITDREGRNLRVIETRMREGQGLFGSMTRQPEPVPGEVPHTFGQIVERAGHVALNDTLLVVTEPRENRFHVFDLRTDAYIGAFGDNYSDSRRLRSPRGVALFADGRIAVADHDNDRIAVFSADLATLLGTFPLRRVEGVTISTDGRLFAWDDEGLMAGEFPLAGGAFQPFDVGWTSGGVSAMAADVAGNVYLLRRRSGRVAVLNPSMGRLLARMGGQRGLEEGDHLAVDLDGNVYATDLDRANTVSLRWGVDVPGVATLAARWEPAAAQLTWSAVPGSFVTGYQLEGAAESGGPWSRAGQVEGPSARVEGSAYRFYRVRARTLTGGAGPPSPAAPVLHLSVVAAFEAGDWDRARARARAALAAVEAEEAEATEATVRLLNWTGLVAAHEAGDWADVLVWQEGVGATPPTGRAFEHAWRLSDAHQELGQLDAAMAYANEAVQGAPSDAPAERVFALRQRVFDDAWELGELDQVSQMGEAILSASPAISTDPDFVERLARAHIEAGGPVRAMELLEPIISPDPAAAPRRLLVVTFMAVAALGDYERAMQLADVVGNTMDADLFVPFQGTLARVRLENDDLAGARFELLSLLSNPRDQRALADPAVARALLMVYGAHVENADAERGRALVDSMVAVLPADLADLRGRVLQRADSVGAVADTRAKLGEAFQLYRDALFRDALRVLQEADARTDLDVEQRLLVKELLAGSYYSLALTEEADEAYRGVFDIDPDFSLVDHLERVGALYGLPVFTEDQLNHFLGIAPLL